MTIPARTAPEPLVSGPGPHRTRYEVGYTLLRARLLLSSYAPLHLILFARIDQGVRFAFLALAIFGLLDANRLTWLARGVASVHRTFIEVKDSGAEVAGYLATYLLPFLAAPDADLGDLWAYGIYAVVVVVVTLRSNLAHVNPTIYLLGWKVVTVVQEDGRERYLICRHAPAPGVPIRVSELYGVLQAKD